VRHVITNAEQVDKFTEIPGDFGRIAIGDAPASWLPYRLADAVVPPSRLATQTGTNDPMLIYFTSGTTSRPKPAQHTHRSYQAPDRATADAIFAYARRNLAHYQRIRRIEFMELPKTISGKIRRVDLMGRRNTCEPNDLTHEYRDR
jgi:acyl-coenzyme A synthetase/AMP-(fatty) acid ligase